MSLAAAAHAIADAVMRDARPVPGRPSGVDLLREHAISALGRALGEPGADLANAIYLVAVAVERARLAREDERAARTRAQHAAEQAERLARAEDLDRLEHAARAAGRSWRARGMLDVDRVIDRVIAARPELAGLESFVRAGFVDEDDRIASEQSNPCRSTP